jgi:hypothetical protein
MEYVRDVLQIKAIERRIGRKLNEDECDGEPFLVQMPSGIYKMFRIHLIKFPWGLCERTIPLDASTAEQNMPVNKLVKAENAIDTGGWAYQAVPNKHFPFYESTHEESEDFQSIEEESQEIEKVQLCLPSSQCHTKDLALESDANRGDSEREGGTGHARMSDVQGKDAREFKSEAV